MKTCLLIIDLQAGLFAEEPKPADADVMIDRINDLAERARGRGVPVIFIQHEEAPELPFDSSAWQLDRRVQSRAGDVRVRKTTVDSFYETTLLQILKSYAAEHLVICGYASEFCVDSTFRRAASLGFHVTLVSDGHTTQDKPHLSAAAIRDHHTATLKNLSHFRGKLDAQPAVSFW